MEYLHKYYDSYDKSIGIVTGLLDTRIFDAKIESLTAILSPLGIAMRAPAISNATPVQIIEVQSAIAKLQALGRISDDLEQSLGASGWNLQPADGSAAATPAEPSSGMDTYVPDVPDGSGDSGDSGAAGSPSPLGPELGGGGRIKRTRKTTKRSRKSTRRRKSKRRSYKKTSKRKKGHKSKRRSMREVKDKLIHLINSL